MEVLVGVLGAAPLVCETEVHVEQAWLLEAALQVLVCEVPRHWCAKRKYMSSKRGYEKPPFKLPESDVHHTLSEHMQCSVQKTLFRCDGYVRPASPRVALSPCRHYVDCLPNFESLSACLSSCHATCRVLRSDSIRKEHRLSLGTGRSETFADRPPRPSPCEVAISDARRGAHLIKACKVDGRFIEATGIARIREAVMERESAKSMKGKQRDKAWESSQPCLKMFIARSNVCLSPTERKRKTNP